MRPSAIRWMLMASTEISLPVGGMPFTSPTWVPVPVHRTTTRSPLEKMSSMPQWPATPSWYTETAPTMPSGALAGGHLWVVHPVVGGEQLRSELVLPLVAHLLV